MAGGPCVVLPSALSNDTRIPFLSKDETECSPHFQAVLKGTKVITEGDLNADYFYIVQSGRDLMDSDGFCWVAVAVSRVKVPAC